MESEHSLAKQWGSGEREEGGGLSGAGGDTGKDKGRELDIEKQPRAGWKRVF